MNVKIVTKEEMHRIEAAADVAGLSYAKMMEAAGRQVVEAMDEWIGVQGAQVVVLVGGGNNGGDGLVAARHLLDYAATPRVYVWNRDLSDDDENWRQVAALGISVVRAEEDQDHETLRQWVLEADAVVDALLGTGARVPLPEDLAALLDVVQEACETRRCPLDAPLCAPSEGLALTAAPIVVAVDLPSGLEADTGRVDDHTLLADMTVTFAAAKRGQLLADGPQAVGKLLVADIGISAGLLQDVQAELLTAAVAASLLPRRTAHARKGMFGRALVVAGSVNEPGAARLAAAAAGRVGAGGVTVGLPQPIYPLVAPTLSEARYLLLPHDLGVIAPAAEQVLRSEMSDFQACLIGPGLGTEKATRDWLLQMLGGSSVSERRRVGFRHETVSAEGSESLTLPPLVLDSDSLLLLSSVEHWWQRLPAETILILNAEALTKLLDREVGARHEDVAELARAWEQVVVLTGPFTLVAMPYGEVTALPFANPALATAGSGHVLAGAIAGMRAQGLPAFEAALVGGYLHGLAGELARDADPGQHQTGVLASDLLPLLPRAAGRLRGMFQR
jgi:ADP-dependent NAD(P)H-hydrate dehydratase / NAD(P)H-hydrate epimerase